MIFKPTKIGNITLQNRIIRSATFEGMCDLDGFPGNEYLQLYSNLSKGEIGAIITGFAFVEKDGRAIHPGQAGINNADKIPYYKKVTDEVHKNGSKIFMQITHTGRQTNSKATGGVVWGVSENKSPYFQSEAKVLNRGKIAGIIHNFANSAKYAKDAGFDGIQVHAAHGYLIHQFLNPAINNRDDLFGNPTEFLSQIIDKIHEKCGDEFPVLLKISADENQIEDFKNIIKFINTKRIDAIEISYGTMENALNIFRGKSIPMDVISKFNFKYKSKSKMYRWFWKKISAPILSRQIKKFTPTYNLEYAKIAKQLTNIPIICVGGFRKGTEINEAIINEYTDFVSLCRPFICELDYVKRIKNDINYQSKCVDCNICAIMCDSEFATRCYHGNEEIVRKFDSKDR